MIKRMSFNYDAKKNEMEVLEVISDVMGSRYNYLKYLISKDLNEIFPERFPPPRPRKLGQIIRQMEAKQKDNI